MTKPGIKQPLKAYMVNAFTKGNSGGSPTGVVLDAGHLGDYDLQFVTDKIDGSHTAFVYEPQDPGGNVKVRFFTHKGETLNCGHGTIAAHYTRARIYEHDSSKIFLQEAKEGIQQVEIIKCGNDFEVYLKLNEIRFSSPNASTTEDLSEALSIDPAWLSDDFPLIIASPGSNRFLLGLKSIEEVNGITPGFEMLKKVCADNQCIGCFVYAINTIQPNIEATARMFAPNIGVDEDVINGNSSGCLGNYLVKLSGKNSLELHVNQGHKFNQDGAVKVKVDWVGERFETVIGGSARIESEILIHLNNPAAQLSSKI